MPSMLELHVDYEALAEIPREEAEATLQDAETFLREVTELLPELVNDLE